MAADETPGANSGLQARFAGLVSYGLSADLLNEILPLGRALHATTVRRQVQATAQRLEDDGPDTMIGNKDRNIFEGFDGDDNPHRRPGRRRPARRHRERHPREQPAVRGARRGRGDRQARRLHRHGPLPSALRERRGRHHHQLRDHQPGLTSPRTRRICHPDPARRIVWVDASASGRTPGRIMTPARPI